VTYYALKLRRALRRPRPARYDFPAEPEGCSDWIVDPRGSHGPGSAIGYPQRGYGCDL